MRCFAGHSKWQNIRFKKAKNDKAKAALATRFSKQISIAARDGMDPKLNHKLEAVLKRAQKAGVQKSVVERALSKSKDAEALEEVHYEASGPGGALFIVEALTNNKKRTAPEIRHIFKKHEGHMEAKVASFAFQLLGHISVPVERSELVENCIDAAIALGAVDVDEKEGEEEGFRSVEIYCEKSDIARIAGSLREEGFEPHKAEISYKPIILAEVNDDDSIEKLHKIMEDLDENEDVSRVFHNLE